MKRTWLDYVIDALLESGGSAHLSEIYQRVRKMRPVPHPKSFEAIVRRTIQEHSADSKVFRGIDIFCSVDGIGSGNWSIGRIRQPPSNC